MTQEQYDNQQVQDACRLVRLLLMNMKRENIVINTDTIKYLTKLSEFTDNIVKEVTSTNTTT